MSQGDDRERQALLRNGAGPTSAASANHCCIPSTANDSQSIEVCSRGPGGLEEQSGFGTQTLQVNPTQRFPCPVCERGE